jgi:hypothetical protein
MDIVPTTAAKTRKKATSASSKSSKPKPKKPKMTRAETAANARASRTPNQMGGRPPQKHCKRGHLLSDDNVYIHFRKDRGRQERQCKTCMDARSSERRAAWCAKNPERYRAYMREYMKRRCAAKAEARAALDKRACPVCTAPLAGKRIDARFCSTKCRKQNKRHETRGEHC